LSHSWNISASYAGAYLPYTYSSESSYSYDNTFTKTQKADGKEVDKDTVTRSRTTSPFSGSSNLTTHTGRVDGSFDWDPANWFGIDVQGGLAGLAKNKSSAMYELNYQRLNDEIQSLDPKIAEVRQALKALGKSDEEINNAESEIRKINDNPDYNTADKKTARENYYKNQKWTSKMVWYHGMIMAFENDRANAAADLEELNKNNPLLSYYFQLVPSFTLPWKVINSRPKIGIGYRFENDPITKTAGGFWLLAGSAVRHLGLFKFDYTPQSKDGNVQVPFYAGGSVGYCFESAYVGIGLMVKNLLGGLYDFGLQGAYSWAQDDLAHSSQRQLSLTGTIRY
jgi:hypothetical protein